MDIFLLDTQKAAIADSSFPSISTCTFLKQTTESSCSTWPQMGCSSHERPFRGDIMPKILTVRPQGW